MIFFFFFFSFLLPCEGQSLSGPLFPLFPPALLNLSCLFSPFCVLCNKVGKKNLFQICGFSFIISLLSNKGKKHSEVCQTQRCEHTHTHTHTKNNPPSSRGFEASVLKIIGPGDFTVTQCEKYRKGDTICVNHAGS